MLVDKDRGLLILFWLQVDATLLTPCERERVLRYTVVDWHIGFTVLRDDVVSIFRLSFCYFPAQHDGVLNLTQVGTAITAPGIIALKGRTVVWACDMLGLIHRPVWVVVRMPVGHLLYRSVPVYAELGNRQRVEPPDFL